MISFQKAARGWWRLGRNLALAVLGFAVAACAPEDSTVGSRLAQPPPDAPPRTPIEAGDIAIVGQDVANSIMDLPGVADATVPPLVQFTGVTSIIQPPIDTDPYTELLRDRLLLLTREKLRFVERTLPPYIPPTKKGRPRKAQSVESNSDSDYQVLAELRGRAGDDFYRIQVQFVDLHSNQVLFDGLYRIRREASDDEAPAPVDAQTPVNPEGPSPAQAPEGGTSPLPPDSPTL